MKSVLLGVLLTEDQGGIDPKTIAVPLKKVDPTFSTILDINDVPENQNATQVFLIHFLYNNNSSSAEMLPQVVSLIKKYNPIDSVMVDGQNVDFIRLLKQELGEEVDYQAAIERYKAAKIDWTHCMDVIPINFHQTNRNDRSSKNDTGKRSVNDR